MPSILPPGSTSPSGWDILYTSIRLAVSAWANQPADGEVEKLQELVRMVNPQVILDLGTRFGGLTLAMYDAAPEAHLLSFDLANEATGDIIRPAPPDGEYGYDNPDYFVRRSWFPDHVKFYKLDFTQKHLEVKKLVDNVRTEDDVLFVMVDGWDTRLEASLYAPWLRAGDVMAVSNAFDFPVEEMVRMLPEFQPFMPEWIQKAKMAFTYPMVKV